MLKCFINWADPAVRFVALLVLALGVAVILERQIEAEPGESTSPNAIPPRMLEGLFDKKLPVGGMAGYSGKIYKSENAGDFFTYSSVVLNKDCAVVFVYRSAQSRPMEKLTEAKNLHELYRHSVLRQRDMHSDWQMRRAGSYRLPLRKESRVSGTESQSTNESNGPGWNCPRKVDSGLADVRLL
ncbi:hypothetical protein TBK1r_51660 [Stieleria magnilauensis]|uniref:Uncharacterized protein n=2 Tax=Stieleria magnilauensis TaxID=2527963 RepID=A0ABX5XVU4_9BACT|nr:hypothetical protein TBK1r_51660 [Planctomycetes bacterium TBK1r]